jgi:hypothetical protein
MYRFSAGFTKSVVPREVRRDSSALYTALPRHMEETEHLADPSFQPNLLMVEVYFCPDCRFIEMYRA